MPRGSPRHRPRSRSPSDSASGRSGSSRMIRINLLAEARPQRKKKGVAALGAGGRLNTLLLGGVIGLAILVGVVHYWVLRSQIKAQEEKIRIAQVEARDFDLGDPDLLFLGLDLGTEDPVVHDADENREPDHAPHEKRVEPPGAPQGGDALLLALRPGFGEEVDANHAATPRSSSRRGPRRSRAPATPRRATPRRPRDRP